jgi:hypothetical protein
MIPAPVLTHADTEQLDISSEKCRCYHYNDGQKYRIDYPKRLYLLKGGSHRVVDESGTTHRPTPGWLAISWTPKDGQPAFVA